MALKDISAKEHFRSPYHFSDFINAALYDGKQIVKPEELIVDDTDVSSLLNNDLEQVIGLHKNRDITMIHHTPYGDTCYGIENQSQVDAFIILRAMTYDHFKYLSQRKIVKSQIKELNHQKNILKKEKRMVKT